MTNLAERIEQSGALNPPADLKLIETEAVETKLTASASYKRKSIIG